jgi:hypothetical protein
VDLCLFPTAAYIEIELTDQENRTCEERPDNSRASWLIRIPRGWLSVTTSASGEEISPLALATTILGQCTALPFERFKRVLESAFEEGFATKTFSIRPARELFAKIHSKETFLKSKRTEIQAPPQPEWFKLGTADELKWCDKEGPGYSKQQSENFIRNRYENALRPIRLTLPRLMIIPRIVSIVRSAQEDLPDWQILNVIACMVVNFRIRHEIGSTDDVELMQKNLEKWMFRDEEKSDPEFPSDSFTTEQFTVGTNVALLSNLKT